MTFNIFAQTVISQLEERLADFDISEQDVIKHNDMVLHGVAVRRKGSDVAPTMYLDASFEDYRNGQSIENIVEYLVNTVYLSEPIAPIKSNKNVDFSFEAIKDKLTARLIDAELNREYLKSHHYGIIGAGLVIIAELNLNDEYRCVITKNIAEQNNLDMSLVFETAVENMQRKHPAVLMNMEDAIFGNRTNILKDGGYIGTMGTLMCDGMNSFGAMAITYKGITDKIREGLGNFYILPSSLHELIILRDSNDIRVSELKDMVIQANQTVVQSCDVLSNSVFYCDAEGLHRVA